MHHCTYRQPVDGVYLSYDIFTTLHYFSLIQNYTESFSVCLFWLGLVHSFAISHYTTFASPRKTSFHIHRNQSLDRCPLDDDDDDDRHSLLLYSFFLFLPHYSKAFFALAIGYLRIRHYSFTHSRAEYAMSYSVHAAIVRCTHAF